MSLVPALLATGVCRRAGAVWRHCGPQHLGNNSFHTTTVPTLPQRPTSPSASPYHTLGVPIGSSFDEVKRAFVQLALQTHPDQQQGKDEKNAATSTAAFLRIRQAFEQIQQEQHGGRHGPSGWSAQELRDWWQEETGEFLSFAMSESTRHEVIRAYHTMGPGSGRDKGGYWEMARQLAEREANMQQNGHKPSEDDRPLAQIESSANSSSIGRRRRR